MSVVGTSNEGVEHGFIGNPGREWTVAKLREECKKRGLRNYGKLRRAELILLLQGTSPVLFWRSLLSLVCALLANSRWKQYDLW